MLQWQKSHGWLERDWDYRIRGFVSNEDVFISEKKSKGEIGRDILISLCASSVSVCI